MNLLFWKQKRQYKEPEESDVDVIHVWRSYLLYEQKTKSYIEFLILSDQTVMLKTDIISLKLYSRDEFLQNYVEDNTNSVGGYIAWWDTRFWVRKSTALKGFDYGDRMLLKR
jgi:hypothetical protein